MGSLGQPRDLSSEQTLRLGWGGPGKAGTEISRQTALQRGTLGTLDIDVPGAVPAGGDPISGKLCLFLAILATRPQGYFSLLSICIASWREMNYIPPGSSVPYN